MTDIHITNNMTTEALRQQLHSFGLFSAVEASVEEVANGKEIVLHEISLGARLRRALFVSSETRNQQRAKSHQALQTLAQQRPEFGALLGTSIQSEGLQSPAALCRRLAFETKPMRTLGDQNRLQVPYKDDKEIGVANSMIVRIDCDTRIVWGLRPVPNDLKVSIAKRTDKAPGTEVTVNVLDVPNESEMREAYAAALVNAKGHTVIAPIADIPVDKRSVKVALPDGNEKIVSLRHCTDLSLRLLLKAIDEARKKNPDLGSVTIAAGQYPDKFLHGRIVDQRAILVAAREPPASDPAVSPGPQASQAPAAPKPDGRLDKIRREATLPDDGTGVFPP